MKDELANIEHRLRWLIGGIVAAALVLLIAVLIGGYLVSRRPDARIVTTVVATASAPAAVSKSDNAAAPAPSPSQIEASAAAAMRALAASSRISVSEPQRSRADIQPTTAAVTAASAVYLTQSSAAPATVARPEPSIKTSNVRLQSALPAGSAATSEPRQEKTSRQMPARHSISGRATAVEFRDSGLANAAADRKSVSARDDAFDMTAGLRRCINPGWYVQLGAFAQAGSIERLASRLRKLEYRAFCIGPSHPKGLKLFYVGAYRSAQAAQDARDRLEKQIGTLGLVRQMRTQ